ncbi:Methyltransferase type 12 [Thioalkalivibrio nitratireducens DSM 14787]|uniref:Methyltransferase type 12 n=1 Tax=Thioalkalivibrio nitratireducens (strain DSM 14787 / UNIQEM 213 / ALEN2) TaxID=1255043 RepID=L0DZW6_THIND|nr:class I SAM-dependent methyltransferase [Thioalkalivibrio nitratireducens]AGA33901.1 Methyltransferase type 12 [Thioalkalivibrio nitratireducens DSM 14787]
MNDDIRSKWDARHAEGDVAAARPCAVLEAYAHLLPRAGTALDLACGLGGNAQWLASRGLETAAWDISPVAIAGLGRHAGERGLPIRAEVRDVERAPPEPEHFDVIVVSYFLERELAPALMRALRPGGLLFYQTWTQEAVDARGPENPAFRLAPNELLQLFAHLRLIAYREEGVVGDPGQGLRNEAWLVATRNP